MAAALVFVFPNAVEHFHAGEETGVAALGVLESLFHQVGTGFVVAEGEQG